MRKFMIDTRRYGTKASEFIDCTQEELNEKAKESGKNCTSCFLHDEAYNKLPEGVLCPHCSTYIDLYLYLPKLFVVSEDNGDNINQRFRKLPVYKCSCGKMIALYPIEIIYNANHQIYYTRECFKEEQK